MPTKQMKSLNGYEIVDEAARAENAATRTNLQTQHDTLKARVDNLVTPEGSTLTLDAEVIDARVGPDGRGYPTLGEAFRGETSILKDNLSNYSNIIKAAQYLGIRRLRGSALGEPLVMTPMKESDTDVSLLWYIPDMKTGDKVIIKPVGYPVGEPYEAQLCHIINGVLDSVDANYRTYTGEITYTIPKNCDLYITIRKSYSTAPKTWEIAGGCGNAFQINQLGIEFGYFWSVEPITTTYNPDTNTIAVTIPQETYILTKTGLIQPSWSGTLVDGSRGRWLLYDVDSGEYTFNHDITTHRKILLGIVAYNNRSWVGGITNDNSNDKTIAFLGDSITAGSGTVKPYHMVIAEDMGYICKNYGYGGSGYAYSFPSTGGRVGTGQEGLGASLTSATQILPNDFLSRITTIPTTVDGLVIFGGTNDFDFNVALDEFTTAVDNVLSYALTNFTGKPIIVILPFQRLTETNEAGLQLTDYIEILKNSCKKYSIPCVDAYGESGVSARNTETYNHFFARDDDNGRVDGIHPNKYAHRNLAHLVESVMKIFY